VWNGPRHPYLFEMKRKNSGKQFPPPNPRTPRKVQAEFTNTDVEGAELYWEEEVCVVSLLISNRSWILCACDVKCLLLCAVDSLWVLCRWEGQFRWIRLKDTTSVRGKMAK
jgi:hypothetical protein